MIKTILSIHVYTKNLWKLIDSNKTCREKRNRFIVLNNLVASDAIAQRIQKTCILEKLTLKLDLKFF